ncbi:hypothetical protein MOU90_002634 [Vibrio parahaemolyticus]|nr:hypothetical protein [Vibrio parahaemolyticus]
MATVTVNKVNDIDMDKAILRMKRHASKSQPLFAKNLKVKAPKSTYGRLSGPAKA